MVLRGIGRDPCGQLYPASTTSDRDPQADISPRASPSRTVGRLTLTIADFDTLGSGAFPVQTPTPIYVLPGDTDRIEVAYEPDGAGSPASATITMDTDAPGLEDTPIQLRGNECDGSGHPGWDADNDGWTACGGDCDDTDPAVHPGAVERPDNSIDDDCDDEEGEAPDDPDADSTATATPFRMATASDTDPTIAPGADESANQIDDDCDGFIDEGTDLYDDDGDGLSEMDGDCDDGDVLVVPGRGVTERHRR